MKASELRMTRAESPAAASRTKIKKSGPAGLGIDLVQTPDVLAGLVAARRDPHQVIVGFAAETPAGGSSLVELGRAKLARKGCDLLVLNEVGPGLVFGQPDSEIIVLGGPAPVGPLAGSKDLLAHRIWDEVLAARDRR